MKIGILGLGLMGGSAARCYSALGHSVYAQNRSRGPLDLAIKQGVCKAELTSEVLKKIDLLILCAPPEPSMSYLVENCDYFSGIVVDFCGVKTRICNLGFSLSKDKNWQFIGTHPMCGTENSGYNSSFATMYKRSSIVICTPDNQKSSMVEGLLSPLGFENYVYMTAEEHDRVIAYSSQLAHCISTSFTQSPTRKIVGKIRSGSFNDMIRVSSLVPEMWSELMVANRKNLVQELDTFISNICKLRSAISEMDREQVELYLQKGRDARKEIDEMEGSL